MAPLIDTLVKLVSSLSFGTYRVIICCHISRWTAHRHINLIIRRPVYDSEEHLLDWQESSPGSLEKFPVQRTGGQIESTLGRTADEKPSNNSIELTGVYHGDAA
jgi:hypothetical protein